jgi:hypothetical protein
MDQRHSQAETAPGLGTSMHSIAENCAHTSDFLSVVWYGQPHSFTSSQAAAIRLLWAGMENGDSDVPEELLLDAAGCPESSVARLFYGHAACRR